MSFHVPEKYRVRSGQFGSDASYGNNGAFFIPALNPVSKFDFKTIASDGEGWEHVSVSLHSRCPTWPEMSYVKGWFWDEGDCVLQFHPPRSEYVNNHEFCLHMWRPVDVAIPLPPSILVGYKSLIPAQILRMSRAEQEALYAMAQPSNKDAGG